MSVSADVRQLGKVLLAAAATSLALFAIMLGIKSVGLMTELPPHGPLVLAFMSAGLIIVLFLGFFSAGWLHWQIFGFELCAMTMGTALSTLVLQLTSSESILKSVPQGSFISIMSALLPVTGNPRDQAMILFSGMFLVSLIFCLIAAIVARSIHSGPGLSATLLSAFNYCLGIASLFVYTTIVLLGS